MSSMMSVAYEFLKNTNKKEVTQVELLEHVSQKTGRSKEVVRGTLCKAKNGLYSPRLLKELGFGFERKPARLIRGYPPKIYQSYACPIKEVVRAKILSYVTNARPKIITFAGHEGLCVRQIQSQFPKSVIHNVEYNNEAYENYRKLKLGTRDYQMTFSSYFKEYGQHISNMDLLFYDSVGYLCSYMVQDFKMINDTKNITTVAVTLLNIRRFRNTGAWVSEARRRYAKYEDPTKQAMIDLFSNYNLEEEIQYGKTNVKGARGMRVFVFKLKGAV